MWLRKLTPAVGDVKSIGDFRLPIADLVWGLWSLVLALRFFLTDGDVTSKTQDQKPKTQIGTWQSQIANALSLLNLLDRDRNDRSCASSSAVRDPVSYFWITDQLVFRAIWL